MMTTGATCSQCGAAITAGARFCMRCGADISGEQVRLAPEGGGRRAPRAGHAPAPSQVKPGLLEALREATLGEYEVLVELGRGGMATVFLAHDIQLDRKVAIKVMHPQLVVGEGMVERFKLEARTSAGLSHPHIIPIYAVRQTDDLLYFVMKFIEGRPLDSIIKEAAPLPLPLVRVIIAKVGEALGYAHRRGVVHRDIKPANIMIDTEGTPIVTDFGIAKVTDKQGLTMTGATIGTPTYMSPEQCTADEITGASDQYSLGVLAYEMLTGRVLYDGDSVMTIMFKHCHDPVPPPASLGPAVPPEVASALLRMLQKDPRDRWPTIEEALPHIVGAALAYDDTVRTQMVEFAVAGGNRAILQRVSTPRSPIPLVRRPPSPLDSEETVRVSSAPRRPPLARPAGPRPAGPRASHASRRVALGAMLAVAVGAAVLMWSPWASPATSGGAVARGDAAGAAPLEPVAQPASAPPADASAPAAAPADSEPAGAAATPPPRAAEPPATPVVRTVRITEAPAALRIGQTAALRAVALDQFSRQLSRPVRWISSDAAVVSVSPDGRATAVGPGRATVTAVVDGQRAQTAIVVTVAVARVTVSPLSERLRPGETVQLTAAAIAPDGSPVDGRGVAWRSSNENVAVVAPDGRVSGTGPGSAVITAVIEGLVGSAQIVVSPPAAAAPEPAAQPPAPEPGAVAPVEDAHAAIEQLVADYARALQAKNMARVRQLFPEIGPEVERDTRDALGNMENLRVRLAVSGITVSGSDGRAQVTGEWVFRGGQLAVRNTYVFQRRSNGWVIVGIE